MKEIDGTLLQMMEMVNWNMYYGMKRKQRGCYLYQYLMSKCTTMIGKKLSVELLSSHIFK